MNERLAVVLFNLGGPDRVESIEPFLFNLFVDPAIIRLPSLLRRPLARRISKKRAPIAREIYAYLGGSSPLLSQTNDQAEALRQSLRQRGHDVQVFVSMRYWHPRSSAVVADVCRFNPSRIVLLPLYPQYSTTTTGSSFNDWHAEALRAGLKTPVASVCCYPTQSGFVAAHVQLIRAALAQLTFSAPCRLLFSAHGLPQRVVDRGDPYQWQVEQTVAAVMDILGTQAIEHSICYQSRVGPLKWIGPSTVEALEKAALERKSVLLVPIAFVSEHSETLVELDIEYRKKANELGVPGYARVPAIGTTNVFINGLADIVEGAMSAAPGSLYFQDLSCPETFRLCAQKRKHVKRLH